MDHDEHQKRIQRARKALAKVDRLLSEAQDVIGTELSTVEFHAEFPKVYDLGDKVFNHVEAARRMIARRR
jgi:pyruvate kinase